MTRKFTPVWGDTRAVRPRNRPAAASADTDAESGTEPESVRQSLRALTVMLDRGLMTRDEYDARRTAILKRSSS